MTQTPTGNKRKMTLKRRWAIISTLVFTIALFALIGAELVVRTYVWNRGWTPNCYAASLQLFRPNQKSGYDLQPDFRLRSGRFVIATNSFGLRGPEISTVKAAETTRIVIMGGSSAFGYFVSDGQEAARLLEKSLLQRQWKVQVLNAGVPGYNLNQSIDRFHTLVKPLNPDIVILYAGWNDLTYVVDSQPDSERFVRLPVASTWERTLGRSTLYGLVFHRLLGDPVRLAPAKIGGVKPISAGALQFERNLTSFANAVEESGARLIVCAQATAAHPKVDERLKHALSKNANHAEEMIALGQWLHKTLDKFATQRELPFIDAYEQIPPTSAMLGDYVHLTAEGESELARLLTERLSHLLSVMRNERQKEAREGMQSR